MPDQADALCHPCIAIGKPYTCANASAKEHCERWAFHILLKNLFNQYKRHIKKMREEKLFVSLP